MKVTKRHIARNHGGKRARTDGVVLHSTGSNKATTMYGWFNNPAAKASAHDHIANDGTIEEYLDSDLTAWATGQGNRRLYAIETQGDGTAPWTEAQLDAIAWRIAQKHKRYGFPLRLMRSSKSTEKGIGYHRLGVPRSRWGVGVWLIAGGERWSSAVGKICPGDPRIAQMPEVLKRVKAIVGDTSPSQVPAKPKPVKPKKVTIYQRGSRGAKVGKIQRFLRNTFPAYRHSVNYKRGQLITVDNIWGAQTDAWVAEFQERAGLVPDKVVGPLTIAAFRKYGLKL